MKNRREALRNTFALGAGAALGMAAKPSAAVASLAIKQDEEAEQVDQSEGEDLDRQAVLTAGFTEAEADCWKATAEAAGTFFALPEMHPMDQREVASAIHILQNKLLSRPTYRKYLEEAKRLRE